MLQMHILCVVRRPCSDSLRVTARHNLSCVIIIFIRTYKQQKGRVTVLTWHLIEPPNRAIVHESGRCPSQRDVIGFGTSVL